MKSILKDLKLESLFSKFAAKRMEPENVSELSDDDFVRLGVTTIEDRHRLRALCAAALSERVPFFSGRSGSSRRGGLGEK